MNPVNWRLSIPGGASSHLHVVANNPRKLWSVRCTKLRTVALSGRQKSSDLQKQLLSCNQSPLNIQNRPAIDPKQLQVYCSPTQKQQARCVHPMFLAENVWRKKNNSIASGGLPWCHRCAWDFWSLSMQAAERWKNTCRNLQTTVLFVQKFGVYNSAPHHKCSNLF